MTSTYLFARFVFSLVTGRNVPSRHRRCVSHQTSAERLAVVVGGYAEKTFSLVHEYSLIVAHIKPINQLCCYGKATVERKGIIRASIKLFITHHLRFDIVTTQKRHYTIILPHICALVKFFMKEGVSLENWIAEAVGKMHVYGISQTELAERLGVGRTYLNRILNSKKTPANAKERVLGALDELIKAKG